MNKKLSISMAILVVGISAIGAFAPLKVSAAPSGCVARTLQKGSTGVCVSRLQTMLNGLGTWHRYYGYHSLAVDGDFGSHTDGQVRAYQDFSWNLVVDGIVGRHTWTALCEDARNFAQSRMSDYPVTASNTYSAGADAGCNTLVDYSY